MMLAMVMFALLAVDPAATAHGISVPAPEGWVASRDGNTFVFSAPGKDASLRIDLFEKDNSADPQDCVDQLLEKLSSAEKMSKESYVPGAIDGQPSATQVTFTKDRKHRQKRLVGCNGKSYFLIDWVELTHAGPKYEKAFTKLLTGIHYAAPKAP
jgi:hypothetical protein